MGQENGAERQHGQVNGRLAPLWGALLALLIGIGSYVLRNESRLSKIEQRLDDGIAVREELRRDVDRLEQLYFRRTP